MNNKLFLRSIPLIVGLLLGYVLSLILTNYTNSLESWIRISASSILVLPLLYFFTYFNRWLKVKEDKSSQFYNISFKKSYLGHFLIVVSSILIGYGFILNINYMMIGSLVLVWFADSLLTKIQKQIKV